METFSLSNVLCRPILERDLRDIQEFCKTIWDGHDYVPQVIDDWFLDARGIFAVAEYEGHAIACSKVTWLAEGQWWLEGFRVDPKYQGHKVGSLIHHYVDQWWLEQGSGVIRLMTNSKNKTVHHLCEHTGYTKSFEVRGYHARALSARVNRFTFAVPNAKDLEAVVQFALASPSMAVTNCLVDFGWRILNPTSNRALTDLFLPQENFEDNIFWWRNDKGLLVVWDDFDPGEGEHTMGIGILACELEDMSAFLRDVRHLAAQQKKTSIFWLAPVDGQVELALKQAGYSTDWDNTAYIFEKKHPRDPFESCS
jgi:GNAT superfamily N-acetyltransferase